MTTRFAKHLLLLACCLGVLSSTGAAAAAEPGKDHPLVGRYEGSVMEGYQAAAFDEVGLIQGPFQNWSGGAPELLRVEGKVSLYYYKLPAGRSSLEVLRNYESSLKAKGFETMFSCGTANGSCYKPRPDYPVTTGAIDFALAFDEPQLPRLGKDGDYVRNYFSQGARYLLARRDAPNGRTYASIALAEGTPERGSFAFVRVVDSQAMEENKIVFVDAGAMQKGLDQNGRVNLYGIRFDLDKDVIRPESKPTIDEMAKLMRTNTQLRLQVVGHTDAQGEAVHNEDLSKRRSVAVIAALIQQGIDPRRLTTRGAGSKEPIAPNTDEAGRAKNRRVELVKI